MVKRSETSFARKLSAGSRGECFRANGQGAGEGYSFHHCDPRENVWRLSSGIPVAHARQRQARDGARHGVCPR